MNAVKKPFGSKRAFLVLFACLWLFSTYAGALDTPLSPYRVEEHGLSLELPELYTVFTQDTPDGDPGLSLTSLSGETLRQMFLNKGLYFDAVSPDRAIEITVTITQNSTSLELYNYRLLDESELKEKAQELVDYDYSSVSPGLNYERFALKEGQDILFLELFGQYRTLEGRQRFVQYNSIVNGLNLNVTCYEAQGDKGAELSSEALETARAVLDSLRFDEVLDKPADVKGIVGNALLGLIGVLVAAFIVRVIRINRKKKG